MKLYWSPLSPVETHCSLSSDRSLWHWLRVCGYWVALFGEVDSETGATPLEDSSLCCWPELGDVVVGSNAVAGTDEGGTCWGGPEDAAGLVCGRRRGLPVGGSLGGEQDCDKGGEQEEAWAGSCLSGCSLYLENFPCHMDPWLHLPGLVGEGVPALFEPADLSYSPPVWFDGEWGWKPAACEHHFEVQVSSQCAVEEQQCFPFLVYSLAHWVSDLHGLLGWAGRVIVG